MLRCAHGWRNALNTRRPAAHLVAAIGLRHSSSDSTPSHNVAVLGSGITGLAAAYFLTQALPTAKVTVYEASGRIGGWLDSARVPVQDGTVVFERGPRTLRPNGNGVLAAKLLQELDLAKDGIYPQQSSPAACNRFLYYPDHIVRMPHPSFKFADNLWSMMTEPIFKTVMFGGITEFWKAPRSDDIEDESIADFFSRRVSKEMVDRIMSGVIHGIYAGDVNQLSAKSLFPTQWRDELEAGSVIAGLARSRADGMEVTKREASFIQEMKTYQWDPLLKATLAMSTVWTLKDGLGQLVDSLARHLVKNGNVEFKTSSPVESIALPQGSDRIQIQAKGSGQTNEYTHAISALSPAHLSATHKGPTPLIPTIPTVTVMTVNLYYRTPGLHPEGFGYLIPQATPFENNPERALGVVFDDAYSPGSEDVDQSSWNVVDRDELMKQREQGRLINVNDFAWYNMPEDPVRQDLVEKRGSKMTVMLGGHWWSDWPAFPDEQQGLELAKSVLQRHLGITEEPEAWQVNLQRDCIPQYTVGHEKRLKTAHNNISREFKGKLRVAGNWMSGVGVNDCLRSAWDVVGSLKVNRPGTGLEHIGNEEYVRIRRARPDEAAKE